MTSSRTTDAVNAGVTRCWVLAFAAAGRFVARPIRRWQSAGGQRVLVVAPHPDDEACGCPGTMLLHRKAGDLVWVAYATDGRRSRALGLGPEEMSGRRRREAQAAAALLGVTGTEWLGLREGEWEEPALQQRLAECLERRRPDVIYAPSRIDFHPEHLRVAASLARALEQAGARIAPAIRIYQIQVPLTSALANLLAPTAAVGDVALAALQTYQTQLGSVLRTLRLKRYAASFYGVPQLAEEFWELTAAEYVALHHDALKPAGGRVFRGVRWLPLSDPAAYWTGRRVRRALRGRVIGEA